MTLVHLLILERKNAPTAIFEKRHHHAVSFSPAVIQTLIPARWLRLSSLFCRPLGDSKQEADGCRDRVGRKGLVSSNGNHFRARAELRLMCEYCACRLGLGVSWPNCSCGMAWSELCVVSGRRVGDRCSRTGVDGRWIGKTCGCSWAACGADGRRNCGPKVLRA